MNRGKTLLSVLIVVFVFCKAGVVCAVPMSTAFTYQGRLNDGGSPAEGFYNFGFLLYDDPNEAMVIEVAPPVLQEIEVIDGYFTTKLDFDVEYSGEAYWLGIALWDGQDPNTAVMLSPRQEVTPTPYALHAKSVSVPLTLTAEAPNLTAVVNVSSTGDGVAIFGQGKGGDFGILGLPDIGVYGEGVSGLAGQFNGDVNVMNDLTVGGSVNATAFTGDGGGLTNLVVVETDPTVPANLKDGVDWTEVSSRPAGLDDGDDVGIIAETDPEVGANSTNYLPKWNGSALVTGTIYDDGNVGIGTAIPTAKLHIGGTAGVDGIKFPDGTLQTTSAAELIASLEARIAALENPPGWGTAVLIETDNVGNANYPQIAVDPGGNAVAVWKQNDGTRDNIWSNRYVAGTGLWGTAELIEADAGSASSPQVAVDSSGNAVAVWAQSDGIRDDIWSNRYVEATGLWGTAELIETDDTGHANGSQVAVDSSGNAVAVWSQSDGIRYNIWSNRYVSGTGLWGTAELIETDNVGGVLYPQVAVDGSGNAVAVWPQSDGIRYNILSNRYVASTGLWGTAELIVTDNVGGAAYSQVAVDSSGNAVAVWVQSDGVRSNIWSNRYVASTDSWGTAELIEIDNVGNADSPQVAMDGSGNAFAVWRQYDGTRDNIRSNRYVSGTGWGAAVLIETDNVGGAAYSQVAVDSSGNAVAVWSQSDGARSNILSNRYVPGTGWGTAELIETNNMGPAQNPQVAASASGNAIAVWHQYDGARNNIWSNQYTNE